MTEKILIPFTKLDPKACTPIQATMGAAGFDLVAVSKIFDNDHDTFIYGTGLAVAIPKGYVGLLFPRSSIFKTQLSLANCIGVIDSDYRGEIKALFRKYNPTLPSYEVGDRIAQLLVLPIPDIAFCQTDKLPQTERQNKGFGSTGL